MTVRRSVATVADTLTDVVVRSTDDTFRSSCISLLRVRDTRQLKEAVTRRLWQVSGNVSSFDGADAGLVLVDLDVVPLTAGRRFQEPRLPHSITGTVLTILP